MAQERKVDLSQAESIDFKFEVENTQELQGNDLDKFLDEEEVITGNNDDITPANKPDPKKNVSSKNDDPKNTNSGPSKEDLERLEKEEEEKNSLDKYLDDEEDLGGGKKNPAKQVTPKDPKKDDDLETNEDDLTKEDEGIKGFAEELYKINFFTKNDEDEEIPTTPEELLEKLKDEKEKGANQLVDELAGRHGEEYRDAFYAIFVNGVHPKEYLAKLDDVQTFRDLDLTVEENQIKVIEAGLRRQGWEEADIQAHVKELKTNSELETNSQRYHKALVRSEEADLKKMEEKAKVDAARVEQLDTLYYDNLNTILGKAIKDKEINGIPVTKELAKKAFDIAYTKRWELPKSKEHITDLDRMFLELKKPEYHGLRAQVALLFAQTFEGWDEGKKLTLDLSKIQKKAVSNETNDLFRSVVKHTKQNNISKKPEEKYSF